MYKIADLRLLLVRKCKYTEMYKGTTSDLENIFDYLNWRIIGNKDMKFITYR